LRASGWLLAPSAPTVTAMALDSAKSSSARLVDRRRARVQTPGVGLRARNKVVPNDQN